MSEPEHVGKTAKSVQKTLKGKGFNPDRVGSAAIALLKADETLRDTFKKLKEDRAILEEDLVKVLKSSNRDSITVEGRTFKIVKTSAEEHIKIQKPRLNEKG